MGSGIGKGAIGVTYRRDLDTVPVSDACIGRCASHVSCGRVGRAHVQPQRYNSGVGCLMRVAVLHGMLPWPTFCVGAMTRF